MHLIVLLALTVLKLIQVNVVVTIAQIVRRIILIFARPALLLNICKMEDVIGAIANATSALDQAKMSVFHTEPGKVLKFY